MVNNDLVDYNLCYFLMYQSQGDYIWIQDQKNFLLVDYNLCYFLMYQSQGDYIWIQDQKNFLDAFYVIYCRIEFDSDFRNLL